MSQKKLRQELDNRYGQTPEDHYLSGDMAAIRSYYNHRIRQGLEEFYLDNITWNDLAMDEVFGRVNSAHSTSGEQYLYRLLRCPALNAEDFAERACLTQIMEEAPDMRLNLQVILSRLGKRRGVNPIQVFRPAEHGPYMLLLTVLLILLFLGGLIGYACGAFSIMPLVIMLIANPAYHSLITQQLAEDLPTVQYLVAMISAAKKVEKTANAELARKLQPLFAAGRKTAGLTGWGDILSIANSDAAQLLNSFLLLDLLSYELLKNRLGHSHKQIFTIHEHLGKIDAAIAVASYRQSAAHYCLPQIDFSPQAQPFFNAEQMVHPLIAAPVANSVHTAQALLVTGSNASGKSVFLKSAAINAILAQGIATALCKDYNATAFRAYSSMAIADDVLAGESYFIAEIKSLKRIEEAARQPSRILCVIDEVLRGTNTVERIAASSELLLAFQRSNVLCFAATHDTELCTMLSGSYRMLHFTEQVQEGAVVFDYRLHEGPATSRNALKLLAALGFEPETVKAAQAKAERYMVTGKWENS